MQNILVCGGAGFIGSNLSYRLLQEGHSVICVDNLLTGDQKNIDRLKKHNNFHFFNHDITQPLTKDFAVDAIFHLASPASPNFHSKISYHALPLQTMMANTQGTKILLEYALKNKAKFLFASTSEVYGDPLEHPQKETYRGNVSTTGPRSVYDEAKRFGETLTAYYHRDHQVDARIARIFNTYGPYMRKDDMRMVIVFILQALEGKQITIFGDGKQTRSLCYIDDLVDGLFRLMFSTNTSGEIVNLGSPAEHSVLEYATIIKELTGSKSKIVFSEELPTDDPKIRQPDIARAQKLLDWSAKVSLEEGLSKTITYFQSL